MSELINVDKPADLPQFEGRTISRMEASRSGCVIEFTNGERLVIKAIWPDSTVVPDESMSSGTILGSSCETKVNDCQPLRAGPIPTGVLRNGADFEYTYAAEQDVEKMKAKGWTECPEWKMKAAIQQSKEAVEALEKAQQRAATSINVVTQGSMPDDWEKLNKKLSRNFVVEALKRKGSEMSVAELKSFIESHVSKVVMAADPDGESFAMRPISCNSPAAIPFSGRYRRMKDALNDLAWLGVIKKQCTLYWRVEPEIVEQSDFDSDFSDSVLILRFTIAAE